METLNENLENLSLIKDTFTANEKCLSEQEKQLLELQNSRKMPEFKSRQLLQQTQKHWDLFYKRNETRFFKDRRWTTREFEELLAENSSTTQETRKLLEVGCGVGNLIFPLLQSDMESSSINFYYYACDFSARAVELVKSHALYDEQRVKAFQCDITNHDQLSSHIPAESLDVITMIFVLSAIHPTKFCHVLENLWKLLKPGGLVLFRDYGRYDMAQLRFKPGHKIDENLYIRQDGTSSYFFEASELKELGEQCGYEIIANSYVHRRTLNVKEGIDVPRIFLQGKFRKIAKS